MQFKRKEILSGLLPKVFPLQWRISLGMWNFYSFSLFSWIKKENLVGNSRGKPLNDLLLVSWKWQHHVPVIVNSVVLCLVVNLRKHPLQMVWLYKQEDTKSLVCIQIYTVYTIQIILKYISVCFSSCLGCVWICLKHEQGWFWQQKFLFKSFPA